MKAFIIGLALAALMAAPASAVEYVSFQVRVKGHSQGIRTTPAAINDRGKIAGSFNFKELGPPHGFVRNTDDSYETFDTSDGSAIPVAIGRRGDVTGYNNSNQGFVRAADGTLTIFTVPGADGTHPTGINADGAVTGWYNGAGDKRQHGFIRAPDGAITTVDAPDADSTVLNGIDDLGVTSGVASNDTVAFGFLRAADGTIAETGNAFPESLNNMSWTTGIVGVNKLFVRDTEGRLSLRRIKNLRHAMRINRDGNVAGSFDQRQVHHGFLYSTAGELTSFSAPDAGTGRGQGTLVAGINDSGVIVGYTISQRRIVGFIRLP